MILSPWYRVYLEEDNVTVGQTFVLNGIHIAVSIYQLFLEFSVIFF